MAVLMQSPLARLYKLGRGRLLFGQWNASGVLTGGYIDLGNPRSFTLEFKPEIEKVYGMQNNTAFLSDQGISKMDGEVSFEGDEFSATNLALMLGGAATNFTQAGATVTAETITTNLVLGNYYPLLQRNVSALTDLKIGSVTLVHDVPGTPGDYRIVDLNGGWVQILQNPFTAATVVAGATVTADYTSAAVASLDQVAIGSAQFIQGSLRFLPYNVRGVNQEIYLFNVIFAPEKGPEFVSEKYSSFKLTGAVINDYASAGGAHGGTATFPVGYILNQTAS